MKESTRYKQICSLINDATQVASRSYCIENFESAVLVSTLYKGIDLDYRINFNLFDNSFSIIVSNFKHYITLEFKGTDKISEIKKQFNKVVNKLKEAK